MTHLTLQAVSAFSVRNAQMSTKSFVHKIAITSPPPQKLSMLRISTDFEQLSSSWAFIWGGSRIIKQILQTKNLVDIRASLIQAKSGTFRRDFASSDCAWRSLRPFPWVFGDRERVNWAPPTTQNCRKTMLSESYLRNSEV